MPPKIPPKIRKYASGYDKRRKKKKIEEFTRSQTGALDKFVVKEQQPQVPAENQNVDVEILENVVDVTTENMENENVDLENRGDLSIENDSFDGQNVDAENGDDVNLNNLSDDEDDNLEDPVNYTVDIFYPRNWDALDSKMIDLLVTKGPKRDPTLVKGPNSYLLGRSRRFTYNLYTRALSNGEKCDRDWLVYSKELDRVFCFCCKLFRKGIGKGQLANEGFSDWAHIDGRLREHETGM